MPIKYPPGGAGGSVGPNLTLTGNLIVQGNTTLGNDSGDEVNIYGLITFTNDGAIVSGSHQYGRTAAGNLQANAGDTGHHIFSVDSNTILDVFANGVHITTQAQTGVAPVDFKVVTANHQNIPASTNSFSVWFDTSAVKTWETGPLSFQGEVYFQRPSYAFNGASTITAATNVYIEGAPLADTNATFTYASALTVEGGGNNKFTTLSAIFTPPGIANGVGSVSQLSCIFVAATSGGVSLGNQTATLSKFSAVDIGAITFISDTNVRTITTASGLTVNAPIAGTNVTITNNYALHVDSGAAKFDGRILGSQGVGIASANDLTLGTDGNFWIISGNTQINAIATTGWSSGSVIRLKFTGSPTLKHATAGGAGFASLNNNGSADIVAANNTVVEYMYDGTADVWQQQSIKAA